MAHFFQSMAQLRGVRKTPLQFPMVTGHLARFVLALAATLLLGATSPAFDWSEDARWELRSEDKTLYRLDESMAELGAPDPNREMFVMDKIGLLVRQRNGRAVNLTVLQGQWEMLRNGQPVGRVGQSLAEWQVQVGDPLLIFVHPEKKGVLYYYRASLADIGLMVAEGKVLSIMFVEPGYLRSALERSGYTPRT
jgi:hypothetical protein